MTTRITVPAEARASWELADRWKTRIAEVRAGRLVLKGNWQRAWMPDDQLCAASGRACRTSAVAAVLTANGFVASDGGGGFLGAPHGLGFTAGFSADDPREVLNFETLCARLPDTIDEAAAVIIDTARAAVAACCKATGPSPWPGDPHMVTQDTDSSCSICRDWLDGAQDRRAREKRRRQDAAPVRRKPRPAAEKYALADPEAEDRLTNWERTAPYELVVPGREYPVRSTEVIAAVRWELRPFLTHGPTGVPEVAENLETALSAFTEKRPEDFVHWFGQALGATAPFRNPEPFNLAVNRRWGADEATPWSIAFITTKSRDYVTLVVGNNFGGFGMVRHPWHYGLTFPDSETGLEHAWRYGLLKRRAVFSRGAAQS
ncbi:MULTISPECIES: hypothetical protein [Streptomyces]|uniref:hypothetical protein n=1 Tax=Streptomyces TaxID=1883 RepID=UPI000E680825|nr:MULTISPECIES: hypothetical protein [Streptomyces]MDX3066894.1 hypothetical protein [Streptomyces sp. ND04-05B]MDX3519418.1 hypothetical protein [Streptomyces scabiei]